MKLEVTDSNISGSVDVTESSFSELSIAENVISGTLDISASQARCVYDIRKNWLNDLIVIDAGFGRLNLEDEFWSSKPKDTFEFRGSSYKGFHHPERNWSIERALGATSDCRLQDPQYVKPGTFVLIDNRIGFSLCMRKLHWVQGAKSSSYLSDNEWVQGTRSNFYLSEN